MNMKQKQLPSGHINLYIFLYSTGITIPIRNTCLADIPLHITFKFDVVLFTYKFLKTSFISKN